MLTLKTLWRLIGRTQRDVATATAVVNAVAAIVPAAPIPYSTITIRLRDGHALSWTCKPATGASVWRNFLTWYHGREQSAVYVMRHREGETSFLRTDIMRYEIVNGTEPPC